jgi:hypothetical protein
MIRAVHIARLAFGAWMAFNGLNHFLYPLVAMPEGAQPLAAQLLAAFGNSRLLDVAMALELAGGALLLAGVFVPFALALLMPLSTCALYWALLLNQEPLWALLALLAFALNGLLMLAYLDHYRGVLRGDAVAAGETREASYGRLFANPLSDAPRAAYPGAFVVLLAAIAFYYWVVPFASGDYGLIVLLFPTVVLLAGWGRQLAKRA